MNPSTPANCCRYYCLSLDDKSAGNPSFFVANRIKIRAIWHFACIKSELVFTGDQLNRFVVNALTNQVEYIELEFSPFNCIHIQHSLLAEWIGCIFYTVDVVGLVACTRHTLTSWLYSDVVLLTGSDIAWEISSGAKNVAYYSFDGLHLALCGFGNVAGNMEVWYGSRSVVHSHEIVPLLEGI